MMDNFLPLFHLKPLMRLKILILFKTELEIISSCFLKDSFGSNVIPRNLGNGSIGIILNVQELQQSTTKSVALWSILLSFFKDLFVTYRQRSSAYSATLTFLGKSFATSLKKMMNKVGESELSCGTPQVIG